MIKIIYTVKPKDKDAEIEWLHDQKIFPAIQDTWDWITNAAVVQFGMIVSPEAALSIKLRHKLDIQSDWKQR